MQIYLLKNERGFIERSSIISITVKIGWCALMIIFAGMTLIEKVEKEGSGKLEKVTVHKNGTTIIASI